MSICTAWIEDDDRLADCGCPDSDAALLVVQSAIDVASEILYRLSGQQWPGLCQETRRPCRVAKTCSCPSHLCSCIGADLLVLPRATVTAVDSMLIDGVAFTDYLLYPPNWLVRTDDENWPCCQDLAEPTTELDTWSITYSYGLEPPEGGRFAARILTTEIVKACVSDTTCALPAGAVNVTNRGVTYNIENVDGLVGIAAVDMWLNSVNPKGRTRRARMISPDDVRFIPSIPVGS